MNGSDADAYFLWFDEYGDTLNTYTYSETGYNIFVSDLDLTSDGGYICSGYAELEAPGPYDDDIFVLKLDSSGNYCWSRRYGEVGYDESETAIIPRCAK